MIHMKNKKNNNLVNLVNYRMRMAHTVHTK